MSKTPETDAFLANGCTIPELQAFARKLEKRMNEARESHQNAIIENARLKQELNDADLACNYLPDRQVYLWGCTTGGPRCSSSSKASPNSPPSTKRTSATAASSGSGIRLLRIDAHEVEIVDYH